VLACLAGRDTVVGARAPQRAHDRMRKDGVEVDLQHLPHATHAFDDDETRDFRFQYRPDYEALLGARYAAALVAALLQERLLSPETALL
jgi:dienelactone hydrolase